MAQSFLSYTRLFGRLGFALKLQFTKAAIDAVVLIQLIVVTTFDNGTVVHDMYLVGMANGAKPMRDNQCGATIHQRFERTLNLALRFRVQSRGRFVQ